MKNLFFLLTLAVASLFAACTNDLDESAALADAQKQIDQKILRTNAGAEAGQLAIKVTPEKALEIEAAKTRTGGTRSGVASIDRSLDRIAAGSFRRLIRDPRFEADLQAAGLHLWYKVCFDEEQELMAAARELASSEDILWVEYMHKPRRPQTRAVVRELPATRAEEEKYQYPTDDEHLRMQWHYENRGLLNGAKAGADINLFPAWKVCSGDEHIVVAVIDEPVQSSHPDLELNMWENNIDGDSKYKHGANFCTTNEEPEKIDWNYTDSYGDTPSHGTHIAGTIAAVNGNGEGVCGIAGGHSGFGGVKIMSCQIFQMKGKQDLSQPESAANAMVWAANRGALIAQCSYGYDPSLSESVWSKRYGYEVEAIDYFIERERTNAPIDGGLVIFAAGNDGNSKYNGVLVKDKRLVPGCYASTIAVAATGPDYTPAGYTCYGNWVDISAPGGDSDNFDNGGMVYSTIIANATEPNVQYGYMEGTSMACPHVSGVAALGLSYAHKLGKKFSTEEFRSMLLTSTFSLEPYFKGSKESYGYNYSTGYYEPVTLGLTAFRNKMGGGQSDAYKMLMQVEGTPVVTAGIDQEMSLPLDVIFGGAAKRGDFAVQIVDIKDAEKELDMSYSLTGSELKVLCRKFGSARITLKSAFGESEVVGHLAIICRESATLNGGWL